MYQKRDRGFSPERRFAPVKEGEELDVRIESVGEKGDGVAKVKGFVLFIPGVKQGDEVKVRVSKVLKSVGFAEKIGAATTKIGEDDRQVAKPEPQPEPEVYEDSENFGEE